MPSPPEDAVEPAALQADPRPPSETAISTIPDPAMPRSPADAVVLPAMHATGDRPPLETVSSPPPQPARPRIPEDAMTLAALQTETRPPPEDSIPTPPPPATSPLPEDIAALTASEVAGAPRVEEASTTFPEPEALASVGPLAGRNRARRGDRDAERRIMETRYRSAGPGRSSRRTTSPSGVPGPARTCAAPVPGRGSGACGKRCDIASSAAAGGSKPVPCREP